jgi:hypothetical protein
MYRNTQSSHQLHSIFGGGYVLEQHGDESHRYLLPSETSRDDRTTFEEMMKVLRSALSIR